MQEKDSLQRSTENASASLASLTYLGEVPAERAVGACKVVDVHKLVHLVHDQVQLRARGRDGRKEVRKQASNGDD